MASENPLLYNKFTKAEQPVKQPSESRYCNRFKKCPICGKYILKLTQKCPYCMNEVKE